MTRQLEINFVYEEKKNKRRRLRRDVNVQRQLDDLFVETDDFTPIMPSRSESVRNDLIDDRPSS